MLGEKHFRPLLKAPWASSTQNPTRAKGAFPAQFRNGAHGSAALGARRDGFGDCGPPCGARPRKPTSDRADEDFSERRRHRGKDRVPNRKGLNDPSAGECVPCLAPCVCRGGCTPAGGITACRRTTRAREGPSDTAYRRETCIRPPARGKRKSPKRFCPLPFVLIVDTEGGWGKMSSRFPRGENENLMRNKLRALNWFGQTLSDDLWDFASKQCAFDPNCGKQPFTPSVPVSCRDGWGLANFDCRFHPPDDTPAAPSRSRGNTTLPDESEGTWEECGFREVVIDDLPHEATAQDINCVRG